ncbi:DUF134 domain-containing protein [Malaciobacter canalis]|jgi:predicted DNA-binding protein (UPF0251 family)/predicted Fe-Mo cluster-binding NifX family protein|uniref:DNA-binding protein (UPF0251 family) n=2 Tax=Malaciobacter TaxID=2321114 RepID=A0AB36ZX16_9BACT|nr:MULTISPECIES: DUF134 domain-containing protein [Malaciobacter]PHO09429.1 DUF134 domain-containing protein [Malaciobacter canalis]PPK60865.1 putative DNA-binding protein (UPF0251 family) [Malaciobacter marinus]QEE33552.1 putative DNA-binding protein (DUF134 domain) [Malaciobacter canalis]SKB63106.1 Predicted DNA-binding protein, UPF0251 family [Malaciobacter marinus]
MAREKLERKLNLKPVCKYFGPKDKEAKEDVVLLHEELEAIHLMDSFCMYQEDAAKKMNVSRATFARIVKSARKKISLALITGSNIKVHEVKNEFRIAVCSKKQDELEYAEAEAEYIWIIFIKDYKLKSQSCIKNPMYKNEDEATCNVLPDLLHDYGVNYFMISDIDYDLKISLIAKGIYPILKEEIQLENLVDIFQ